MPNFDSSLVPYLLTALDIVLSMAASAHVILFKRDTRAAIGWIGLIWLSPILGTVLYVLLGINRINRRARSLRRGHLRHEPPGGRRCLPEGPAAAHSLGGPHLDALARL